MSRSARQLESASLGLPEEPALVELARRERWFGARSRSVRGGRVVDAAALETESGPGVWLLLEVDFEDGGADVYQLALPATTALDDLALTPELAHALIRCHRCGERIDAADGAVTFHAEPLPDELETACVRPIGAEQSNSSAVFGEHAILKLYRRLGHGTSVELELLRFLRDKGFANAPQLLGWCEYEGRRLDATLGVLQQFLPGRQDGWELALDCLASDPDAFRPLAYRLGEVTGGLHAVLASDPTDPSFRPERLDPGALAELGDAVEAEVHETFAALPAEDRGLDPIRGRGGDVVERLRTLRGLGAFGVVIRNHGDYHLGQVLRSDGDWFVLDFEGEPTRTLHGRRRKRSPFRDVAGMLRSFAYAAETSRARAVHPPPGWEDAVRNAFLDGYLIAVDPSILPPDDAVRQALLAAFELEKAVYELRYELDHRPGWIGVPVAGILRALEAPAWS